MLRLHLGHASTVAELARNCNLDAGAMTRMLDGLESKGLCKRIRSETDRRVFNIALTDTGRTVAQGIPGVLCTVLNQHLTGLSVEEFSVIETLLQRILANTAGSRNTPVAWLSPSADCAATRFSSLSPGNPDAS